LALVIYSASKPGHVDPESAGSEASTDIAKLNSAELFTRPGIKDFGFPVGALWLCLSRSPTGAAKIVDTTNNGPDDIAVRVQFASGRWADFYFRVSHDAALLYRINASDGSSSEDPGTLKIAVVTMAGACGK
jgi:hypothetical protein